MPINDQVVLMTRLASLLRSVFVVVLGLSAEVHAVTGAPDPGAAKCRELEDRYQMIQAGISPAQLNLLLFASAETACAPLARRLLEAGAALGARDRLGAMPLARAARAGQTAIVELFLARGAAVDARNLAGATALYAAAENEREASVAVLLANGADPNLPGRSGVTPLAAAAFKGNGPIVDALIARAADPDAPDATGKTAIVYAASRGFARIVRRLLGAGVDARRRYGNELTALMWAAGHADGVAPQAALEVAGVLLDAGAPIDAVDDRGRTALMIAAERGRGGIVELLLTRGADRTITDKGGRRAFDLAADDAVRAKLAAR